MKWDNIIFILKLISSYYIRFSLISYEWSIFKCLADTILNIWKIVLNIFSDKNRQERNQIINPWITKIYVGYFLKMPTKIRNVLNRHPIYKFSLFQKITAIWKKVDEHKVILATKKNIFSNFLFDNTFKNIYCILNTSR